MQMTAELLPCHAIRRPDSGARQPRFGGSLHRSSRHRTQYSGNSGQIAGNHRQLEVLVHAFEPTIDSLSKPSDRLSPAKVLFDALSDHLTHSISLVPRGTAIDGAAASSRVVARHMRCHPARSAVLNKVVRVVSLVRTDRLGMIARHAVEQAQCARIEARPLSA